MHDPIRENLEDHLRGSANRIPQEFHAHLDGCEDCATELRLYELQSEIMRSLRPEGEIEPKAGFYARVMDRIESEGRSSIWSVLLQPAVGRRMAVASAALVVLLGTYFVATELNEPMVAIAPAVATVAPALSAVDAPMVQTVRDDNAQIERQRDAVLVNLASFHE